MAKDIELKSDYDEIFEISRTGWERQLKKGMLDLDFYFRAQQPTKKLKQPKTRIEHYIL